MVHRSKVKKTMELVQIYFKNVNKLTIITSTVGIYQFFSIFFVIILKFSLMDPDPGGKMNTDPCGSGSTVLLLRFSKRNLLPKIWYTVK